MAMHLKIFRSRSSGRPPHCPICTKEIMPIQLRIEIRLPGGFCKQFHLDCAKVYAKKIFETVAIEEARYE